jgi:hypothetical protein
MFGPDGRQIAAGTPGNAMASNPTGMTPEQLQAMQQMSIMQMMMGGNNNNSLMNPMMMGYMMQPGTNTPGQPGGQSPGIDPNLMSTMMMNQMLQNMNFGVNSNKENN